MIGWQEPLDVLFITCVFVVTFRDLTIMVQSVYSFTYFSVLLVLEIYRLTSGDVTIIPHDANDLVWVWGGSL